jgi:sister chromatid cohesion protein PDS5
LKNQFPPYIELQEALVFVMPTRTRRSTAQADLPTTSDDQEVVSSPSQAEVTADEEPSSPQDNSTTGLRFNQSLVSRPGRPIPVAELLKRLQTLANEIQDKDQDEDDVFKDELRKVAKELAEPQLLGHKDKGVKAWVACCAVDTLRICAPNAPFTSKQLKVSCSQ